MVSKIILRLEEDDKFRKEDLISFPDIGRAKECYRAGQLEIRKCTGPPTSFEIRTVEYSRSRQFQEDLDNALTDMENGVNVCDLRTMNIANDITRNLTLVDEGIRVGLLYTIDKNKIDSIKNRFERLKSQFIANCACKKKV